MFAPNLALSFWDVEFSYPAGLISRRLAALYAGVGVMFYSARNAEPSSARSALVTGTVVACLTLAALGVYELAIGHAGRGILVAVLIEVAFSLAFFHVARAGKATQ